MGFCCPDDTTYVGIPPFAAFTQFTPALPKFYTDVPTWEQRFKELCKQFCKMVAYSDKLAEAINGNADAIAELQDQFEKFIAGEFDDFYEKQIKAWIEEHFVDLMKTFLNHGVYFGLTDDGYFCANVVWQLTTYFDTIMDYNSDDYGRLVLNY